MLKWSRSRPSVLARLLPALTHSECRRLEGALALQTFWNYAVQLMLPWLVYLKTGSTLALGVALSLQLIPQTVLLPLSGRIATRFATRSTLLLTIALIVLWSVGVFTLLEVSMVSKWTLYGLIVASGALWVIILPAASAYKRELFGSWKPTVRVNAWYIDIGTGMLVAAMGQLLASFVFNFDSIAKWVFVAGIPANLPLWLFVFRSQRGRERRVANAQDYRGMREAFAFLWKTRRIGGPLLMLGLVNVCVGSVNAFAPAMAINGFHHKGAAVMLTLAFTLGRMTAAMGVIVVHFQGYWERAVNWWWGAYGLAVAVYGLFGYFHLLLAAVLAMGCIGFLAGVTVSRTQTVIMNEPSPELVGRVSTTEFATKTYATDMGDLAGGWIANQVGIVVTTIGAGVIAMGIAATALVAAATGHARRKMSTQD